MDNHEWLNAKGKVLAAETKRQEKLLRVIYGPRKQVYWIPAVIFIIAYAGDFTEPMKGFIHSVTFLFLLCYSVLISVTADTGSLNKRLDALIELLEIGKTKSDKNS